MVTQGLVLDLGFSAGLADMLQVRRDEAAWGVLREPVPLHGAAQPVQEVCALGAGEAGPLPA